jgi:Fic family protein/DNA-binding XRE family transcriptional regulator
MTIKDQLLTIQVETRLSQEKMAQALGVSFATLNSWIKGRSQPRFLAQKRIRELYARVTGEAIISPKEKILKLQELEQNRKDHPHVLKTILKRPDLADEFMLHLTYHSNRIEGNTLTMDETASVLFNVHPLADKTFVEQLEVKNHQVALNSLWKHLKDLPLNEDWVLKMHGMLMNGIREDAGWYRNHAVRIVGSYVPTANPLKVPELMRKLAPAFEVHPKDFFRHLALVHASFEKIHPFSDGNGRVGRLLLNAMLLKADFAPALIREEKRRLYYTYLKKAQLDEEYGPLEDFLMDAVLEGYGLLE